MPDLKNIVDMGLSTAILGSFAIPGAGPGIAAALGVVQFFFDLFYPEAQTSSEYRLVTEGELTNALAGLKDELADTFWKGSTKDLSDRVIAKNKLFMTIWGELQKLPVDKEAFMFIQDDTEQKFQAACDSYFTALKTSGELVDLWAARNAITLGDLDDTATDAEKLTQVQHQSRTLGLFGLIGSLTVSYLKGAVTWQWSQENIPYVRYQKYLADKAKWDAQIAAYKQKHPQWQPVPVADPGPPPIWEDWINDPGGPVALLKAEVDDLVAYVEGTPASGSNPATKGLYTILCENWEDRPKKVDQRVQKVTLQSEAGGVRTIDSATGDVYPPYRIFGMHPCWPINNTEKAGWILDARRGTLIAYEWEHWTKSYALDSITKDDLDKFGKTIAAWKAAKASVMFTTYVVQAGDTLLSIATTVYTDPKLSLAARIRNLLDFNPDVHKNNDTVVKDQRIMIPDPS